MSQPLAETIHLSVNGRLKRGEPLVINHQRFDLYLAKFRILGIGLGIERRLSMSDLLFEVRLFLR